MYPTHALRELVKDVAGRLAGRSDKAVRQLELTYGGGKTHTLITLYHLFREPAALPDVPAVREFREHVGAELPAAFPVTLYFDKIDAERGIEGVRGPNGEARALRHPWSVLAFQLACADGLRAIHGEGHDAERETPSAEPLLVKLLERPQQHGQSPLILIEEQGRCGAGWRRHDERQRRDLSRCGVIATTMDIRTEGRAGRLGERKTAVIVEGQRGKEYRLPTEVELQSAAVTEDELGDLYSEIPFGLPDEPISPERPSPNSRGASGLPRYGFDTWRQLFSNRQLLTLATFIREIRRCRNDMECYSEEWQEGAFNYLACVISKLTDYSSTICSWHVSGEKLRHGLSSEGDASFSGALGPKWDHERNDGELVDQPGRFDLDGSASRSAYEDGMFRVFENCQSALRDDGRLVLVFANKQPEAWETLVSALIRAGFVVDASWPIQTEMQNKVAGGARLSASIWLVCRKRPAAARPGWDGNVLTEMQENITERLRGFWDAGIRGPDFVWAATGPALEAFSRHPVVKCADSPGQVLTVAAFLRRVRRMVVGFVVSRLLNRDGAAAGELDDLSTYYLLHRNDFGLAPAPAGACILYALSCNLSDADLAGRLDLLLRGGRSAPTADETDTAEEVSGSEARLKPWHRRKARGLGEPTDDGIPPPLIDCIHKVMQLWKTGEQSRVDGYLETRGLWRHELFARVVQAVIELAERGTDERATLESLQNHLQSHTATPSPRQGRLW